MDNLEKAILRQMVYFDIFEYPLTLWEVWKWLLLFDGSVPSSSSAYNYSLSQIKEALNKLSAKIESQDGFYFLSGHGQNIKVRLNRYNISEEKFKEARKFIKFLRFIPFIKCLIVCNRLGYSNVHPKSDIDLAVIVKKNRLWLARLMSVGPLSLLKVRPKQIKRAKAIDLSFFVSEDNLNLEMLKFPQDVVFTFWVDQFIPVYDQRIFNKFIKENQWLREYLPNSFAYQLSQRRMVNDGFFVRLVKRLLSLLVDWDFMEKWAKKYQLKIMPQDLKQMMNQDSCVVVNDRLLKFHRHDSRKNVQELLNKKLAHI